MIAATHRKLRFLPYRFDDHALALRVERCVLDRQREVSSSWDPERQLLDLSTSRWSTVELEVSVSLEAGLFDAVFPPDERGRPPGRLLVTVVCPATRVRRRIVLADGGLEARSYRGGVSLAIGELAGTVELTPLLVRAAGRAESDDGYGAAAHERLATGRTLEVRVDVVRPPSGDYLDVKYEDFRAVGQPKFPRADAMYQLDCEGDAPVLWLNAGHPKVCEVLNSAGSVGRVARTRDVLFAAIAHAVWSQLFWRAARTVHRVGETVQDWEAAVLAYLLPATYPDAANQESRLVALREDLEAGSDDAVMERLDGALQDLLEPGRHANSLAEELL